jgi:hypothetical protein
MVTGVFHSGKIDFTLTLPAGIPIPSLASMTWDWGDGNVIGPVPLPLNSSVNVYKISYTFASPGPYALILTISNLASTLSWPISVGWSVNSLIDILIFCTDVLTSEP